MPSSSFSGPMRANFNSPERAQPRKVLCETKNLPAKITRPQLASSPQPIKKAGSISSSPYAMPNSPIASAKKPVTAGKASPRPSPVATVTPAKVRIEEKSKVIKVSPVTPSSPELPSLLTSLDDDQEDSPAGGEKSKTMFSPVYNRDDNKERYARMAEDDEFDPFVFIRSLPPLSTLAPRRKALPKKLKQSPAVCLALDLDETLVHCSIQPIPKADLTFTVNFNDVDYQVYVRKRPYLKEFFQAIQNWFEIVVFTASQKVYADKLLTMLDPKGQFITHRLFRDSCVCVDGNYLKDLTVLGRDIKKVALVDNSVQAFGYQINNGIPIESWFDDDDDKELLRLIPFLNKLKDCPDVRPYIKDTFRLEEYIHGSVPSRSPAS